MVFLPAVCLVLSRRFKPSKDRTVANFRMASEWFPWRLVAAVHGRFVMDGKKVVRQQVQIRGLALTTRDSCYVDVGNVRLFFPRKGKVVIDAPPEIKIGKLIKISNRNS